MCLAINCLKLNKCRHRPTTRTHAFIHVAIIPVHEAAAKMDAVNHYRVWWRYRNIRRRRRLSLLASSFFSSHSSPNKIMINRIHCDNYFFVVSAIIQYNFILLEFMFYWGAGMAKIKTHQKAKKKPYSEFFLYFSFSFTFRIGFYDRSGCAVFVILIRLLLSAHKRCAIAELYPFRKEKSQ